MNDNSPTFDPDFQILIKQDGLYLYFPDREDQPMLNLGDPDKVLERFADKMAEVDFEDRSTVSIPVLDLSRPK